MNHEQIRWSPFSSLKQYFKKIFKIMLKVKTIKPSPSISMLLRLELQLLLDIMFIYSLPRHGCKRKYNPWLIRGIMWRIDNEPRKTSKEIQTELQGQRMSIFFWSGLHSGLHCSIHLLKTKYKSTIINCRERESRNPPSSN